MLYMIDSAHVEQLKECVEFYPVDGVTTNPTIISKEKQDFSTLLRTIRDIIGKDRMLHIQTTATAADKIIREAIRPAGVCRRRFLCQNTDLSRGSESNDVS